MRNHLYILWTNNSPIAAEHMIMMYASNSIKNNWWDKVTVIIWGEPQLLICENEHIRNLINDAKGLGVEFSACLTCANQLGTKDNLEEYGFDIRKWGALLTDIIKSNKKLITI